MKNNSARVLPPRRMVGSIVRQINPPKENNRQPINPTTSPNATSSSSANSNNEKKSNEPVCDICAQNVPGPEREKIFAIGKCDHYVCYVCSARLRAICDQQECPICREKLDVVVFSADKTKSFDSYDLKSCLYDNKHRIYFQDERIRAAFEKLLYIECLICLKRDADRSVAFSSKDDDKKQSTELDVDSKRPQDTISTSNTSAAASHPNRGHRNCQLLSVQKLKNHLDSMHKLKLCDLCLTHNKLFPYEYSYYDHDSLRKHIQNGEQNTSHRGHPKCKLCNNIFFNIDDLLQHMSREHYHCHLCGRHNTTQHIYFVDYPSLRAHFKNKHYLCERDNCRHEQFTSAFDTQVDYQIHLVQVHELSSNLTRGEARQQRTITLEAAPHRQSSFNDQDGIPSNAAIVTTGTLATANNPRQQIPESLQAQIRQQRLPSRADFPALGNGSNSSMATSQNLSQHVASRNPNPMSGTHLRVVAGPSGISLARSLGGRERPPDQLNDTDFPPLPEQPKKPKSKGSTKRVNTTKRTEEPTLEQLINANLNLSAHASRGNNRSNKSSKNAKHKPIKIQL